MKAAGLETNENQNNPANISKMVPGSGMLWAMASELLKYTFSLLSGSLCVRKKPLEGRVSVMLNVSIAVSLTRSSKFHPRATATSSSLPAGMALLLSRVFNCQLSKISPKINPGSSISQL